MPIKIQLLKKEMLLLMEYYFVLEPIMSKLELYLIYLKKMRY